MKKRSRRPRTLKLLESAANAIAKVKKWPAHHDISHPTVMLAHAVSSAILDVTDKQGSLENWEYGEYDQTYTFEVSIMFHLGDDLSSRALETRCKFVFDPRKDTLVEMDRVSDEIETFAKSVIIMRRALHAAQNEDRVDTVDA